MEWSDACGEIPFDEIVPGARVRFKLTMNGTQYLSIRDLIMHACDKNPSDSAKIWTALPAKDEACVRDGRFHGRGQVEQPVITFPGAAALLMVLPGENVRRTRSTVAKILARHFTGDPSLIPVIEPSLVPMYGLDQVHRELDSVKASVQNFVSAAEERATSAEARAKEALEHAAAAEAKLAQAVDRAMLAESRVAALERMGELESEAMEQALQGAAANLAVLRQEMDKKRKCAD